jgi:ketosteroid isomerase-like protein
MEEAMKRVLMASVFMLYLPGFLNAAELSQAEAQKLYQSMEEQFTQYFKAKQPEKMASLFTDDGWRITDNGPIVGKEALLKHFEAQVKVFDLDNAYTDQVKAVDENNIQATGRWEGTLKLPDQSPKQISGFWVVTQTKQKDGNWKWAMEGYNMKAPPPPSETIGKAQ